MALAFSEACTFLLPPPGDDDARPAVLAVEASVRADALLVRVLSRSRAVPPVLERDGYWLSLPLIAQLADDVMIGHRQDAAGSAITMRFALCEPGESGRTTREAAPSPSRLAPLARHVGPDAEQIEGGRGRASRPVIPRSAP